MRIITIEDLRDFYVKIAQRSLSFVLSKFTLDKKKRTKSSFNDTEYYSSNWWVIPQVKKRWNMFISGNQDINYEQYVSEKFFNKNHPLKLLSIGSGVCGHELKFAELNPGWEITCIDFSEKLLLEAATIADKKGIKNIFFRNVDIYTYSEQNNTFDIVLFHASLHHFKNMDQFIREKVLSKLKDKGKLIINEFVGANRLQYGKLQRKAINKGLGLIEKEYRQIYKTRLTKKRFYGSGILRMVIADPSECIESEQIMPVIYKYFNVLEEKPYGGNILMPALKDISHHFIELNKQKKACLDRLFQYEDSYIAQNQSDCVFGIYEKK